MTASPLKLPTPPLVLDLPGVPSLAPGTIQISYEGTTCEFLKDPPQKFMCSICTQVVKDPHLTACCGHEFCENCLKEWKRKSTVYHCPHCRHTGFTHILDKQARREINELTVYCPKRSQGCAWQGELCEMKAHEKECSYTAVKCPDCYANVLQRNMNKHSKTECPFRTSKCVYCHKEDAYFKVIAFMHLAECPGYPMDCPNKCGATGIKRSEISTHRETCLMEEVKCPLFSAGCSAKLLRKDLEEHVTSNQSEHLLKLMTAFEKSQRERERQHGELRELRMFRVVTTEAMERIALNVEQFLEKSLTTQTPQLRSIRALLNPGALLLDSQHTEISLTLPNFSQLEKQSFANWESTPFYIDAGYKVRLAVLSRTGKSGDLGAEIRLLKGEFDNELQWPCNISFASIHLSVRKIEGVKIKVATSARFEGDECSFGLSVKGTRYNNVAQCVSLTSHHILWHTDKFMGTLPPWPSAIRAQYLHNDCLTVTLTWTQSQQTLYTLEDGISKLSLKRSDQPFATTGSVCSDYFNRSTVTVSTGSRGTALNKPLNKRRKK